MTGSDDFQLRSEMNDKNSRAERARSDFGTRSEFTRRLCYHYTDEPVLWYQDSNLAIFSIVSWGRTRLIKKIVSNPTTNQDTTHAYVSLALLHYLHIVLKYTAGGRNA